MRVELRDVQRGLDDVRRLVEHDDSARTGHRPDLAQRFEIQRHIDLVRRDHGHGTAAGNHAFQRFAALDPAADVIDQLPHRDLAHFKFVIAGLVVGRFEEQAAGRVIDDVGLQGGVHACQGNARRGIAALQAQAH